MLLRIAITNHLSIKERQEISFMASSLKDVETGLLKSPVSDDERILPAAVIYGANASGKSNVINALRFMRSAILDSHNEWNPEGGVPRTPFALDPDSAKSPSEFEADFIVDGVHHTYGFAACDTAFEAEWLYSYPHGRRRKVFMREGQKFSLGEDLQTSVSGKKQNRQVIPEIISQMTRSNSLFLSAGVQNNHDYLKKIGSFFRTVRVDAQHSVDDLLASIFLATEGIDTRTVDILTRTGTGISGYKIESRGSPKKPMNVRGKPFSSLRAGTRLLIETMGDEHHVTTKLGHRARDGHTEYFDLSRESAGTLRLLVLLGKAYQALDAGTSFIVVELDASLHTQACEAVIALFSSPETNPKGAQILATTHDTNLLQSNLLRRDQIWFTEKDEEGATHLFPLTDIRTRVTDNRERGYLEGRYGAVPFIGPVSELFGAE